MITLKELLLGKETVIKGKEYFSTAKYVQPFIDRMKEFTNEFLVSVKIPDQMTGRIDNPDITYNRVLVQAVLPNKVNGYNEVIGFCYALDVRKPVAKFYKAYMDLDTGNLIAFNPMWQSSQPIEADEPISYADVKKLIELTDDVKLKFDEMSKVDIDKNELDSLLGSWVRGCLTTESYSEFGKVKLSPSNAIDAYSSMFIDSDSDYFVDDKPVTKDHAYEAFIQTITDDKKDLMNKFDKAMLVNKIFNV